MNTIPRAPCYNSTKNIPPNPTLTIKAPLVCQPGNANTKNPNKLQTDKPNTEAQIVTKGAVGYEPEPYSKVMPLTFIGCYQV